MNLLLWSPILGSPIELGPDPTAGQAGPKNSQKWGPFLSPFRAL